LFYLKYRLIALDLDGTLLNSKLELTGRVREAVRRARRAGARVTIATGRMYRSVLPYAIKLGIDVPLITYQGALVKTVSGEEMLYYPVPVELAKKVIRQVKEYGYHINIYLDDSLYVEQITEEGRRYAEMSKVPLHPVGDLLKFLDRDPTKVLVIAKEELLDKLSAELKPMFRDTLHISKSRPHFLEFSHPRATKAYALSVMLAHYGLQREELLAVGDGYNDLEMLEYAGLGVVTGNARDEIKAVADYVAPSNDEDGVAEVIEKFVCSGGIF